MKTWNWVLLGLVLAIWVGSAQAQGPVMPPGGGTAGNPYRISQLGHLVWMGVNVGSSNGKFYALQNSIDASATIGWNSGAGFSPIGKNYDAAFRGVFKGNGNAISNLRINRINEENVGLFGYVRDGAVVENLVLSGCSVTGGWARGTNTSVGAVGGLVGDNHGTISNCHMSGTVVVAGNFDVCAGGLAGGVFGVVSECSAAGTVTGRDFVGGLVGWNFGTMNRCFATASVTGSTEVGGLAGNNFNGTIKDCYATGSVTGEGAVGGLIGHNYTPDAVVSGCYATGTVEGSYEVGGLVGNLWGGTVRNSHATGAVTATGTGDAGGLVGWNGGTISECYATGAVTAPAGSDVGGLVGHSDWEAVVRGCHATGRALGVYCIGGLVGNNYFGSSVSECYATGAVSGNGSVGGLAGFNGNTISRSYATGQASGSDDYIGGLVGNNDGGDATVSDCYATGAATGNGYVGGLVGHNGNGTLGDCYSIGLVTGNNHVGGLVGATYNLGSVTACFWNVEASMQTMSSSGTGKTTAEMKQQATFAGWDFVNVWRITENDTYPYFATPATTYFSIAQSIRCAGSGWSRTMVMDLTYFQNIVGQDGYQNYTVIYPLYYNIWTGIYLYDYVAGAFSAVTWAIHLDL